MGCLFKAAGGEGSFTLCLLHFLGGGSKCSITRLSLLILQLSVKVAVSMEGGAWPQIGVHAHTALRDPSVKEVRCFLSDLYKGILVMSLLLVYTGIECGQLLPGWLTWLLNRHRGGLQDAKMSALSLHDAQQSLAVGAVFHSELARKKGGH